MADTNRVFNLPPQKEAEYLREAFNGSAKQRQQFLQQGSSGTTGEDETLPDIFGLPPDNLMPETNRKLRDSMPVCHFFPSQPVFKFGLDLFFLKSAWTTSSNTDASYTDLLNNHGFKSNNSAGQGIKVAYLADNFPTDTFTNEYGENFLQSMTDVASSTAAQISQFFGVKDARTPINALMGKANEALPETVLGVKVADPVRAMASGAKNMGSDLLKMSGMYTQAGNIAGMVSRMAMGARLDFPMTWKSSGFQPSYSLTIRLYNPNPKSLRSTKKYIVGPIVALMLLGVPLTQDGSTYSWPFLHKIISPGIFELNPGFIQNITVIKGGDQQQISQQQRLGMVDVRIDMGSLYSTMVAGNKVQERTRPTVRKYMDTMLQQGNSAPKRDQVWDRRGQRLGDETYRTIQSIDRIKQTTGRSNPYAPRGGRTPEPSPDQAPTAEEPQETADSRVTATRKARAAFLTSETPTSYGA